MGADLYITKMPRKPQYTGFEVSKKAVDVGYFRDCYNSYGLFAIMSDNLGKTFSWWETAGRKELFNKSGNMTIEGVKQLLEELEPIVKRFKKLPKLFANVYQGDDEYKKKPIKNIKEYHDWADLLIRFLKTAIKKESTIIFSV